MTTIRIDGPEGTTFADAERLDPHCYRSAAPEVWPRVTRADAQRQAVVKERTLPSPNDASTPYAFVRHAVLAMTLLAITPLLASAMRIGESLMLL